MPDKSFNHFDFLHARDVRPLLYNELLAVMLRREDELRMRDNHLRWRRLWNHDHRPSA